MKIFLSTIVNRGLKAKSMKEAFGAKRHERVVGEVFVGNKTENKILKET